MNRYAVINSANKVVNIIKWDGVSPWSPPVGCIAVPEGVGAAIGGTYDPTSHAFTPPVHVKKG